MTQNPLPPSRLFAQTQRVQFWRREMWWWCFQKVYIWHGRCPSNKWEVEYKKKGSRKGSGIYNATEQAGSTKWKNGMIIDLYQIGCIYTQYIVPKRMSTLMCNLWSSNKNPSFLTCLQHHLSLMRNTLRGDKMNLREQDGIPWKNSASTSNWKMDED